MLLSIAFAINLQSVYDWLHLTDEDIQENLTLLLLLV